MSHELRTPLNAIIGFSQYMMAYEELTDDQLDTVGKIEKAAVHLLGMINDILDIAKIEAGRMELHRVDLALGSVLQECMEMVAPMAEEKGLALTGSWDAGRRVVLHSDGKLLRQLFINLLSNAVKFTESGGVDVSMESGAEYVTVTVADTGIGIEPDALERAFDAFTQLENAQQAPYKGTGLGLSLSRQIVQTLGGELRLVSAGRGSGTRAVVKLRRHRGTGAEEPL
jgi:signal transduction histidine kinase